MDDQKNKTFLETVKQIAKKLEALLFVPSASITDERDRLRAYITAVLLLVFVGIFTLAVILSALPNEEAASTFISPLVITAGLLVILFAYALSRTKYYPWALAITFLPSLLVSYSTLFDPPDLATIQVIHQWMIVPLLIGGVMLPRSAYRVLFLAIVVPPIIQLFTLPPEFVQDITTTIAYLFVSFVLIGLVTYFYSRLEAQSVAGVQAKNLAEKEGIIQQLQQAEALQQQRARVIEASYEINSRLATILEPRQLIREVIGQIQELFHYNYVQLYLLDDAGENLVVAGGTGEAGQLLFSRGHHIPIGKGLVGQAAATNAYVLVDDVSEIGTWISNPLLPNTKSELAVPIAIGETVLGVLNVQHDEVGALTTEDVALLQSVATAVAISLQNARQYEQANKRAEQEAIVNQINQQILSAPDIERILQVAAQELGRTLKAQNTTVQLSVGQKLAGNGRNNGENI